MSEKMYPSIGDFLKSSECDYLDVKAWGFNGKGKEPIDIFSVLENTTGLSELDRFNQPLPEWRPPLPLAFREVEPHLMKARFTKRHRGNPLIVDTGRLWIDTSSNRTVSRELRERRIGQHIDGVASFTARNNPLAGKLYSLDPQLEFDYQYSRDLKDGSMRSKDLRFQATIEPFGTFIAATYNSHGELDAFDVRAQATEPIIQDFDHLEQQAFVLARFGFEKEEMKSLFEEDQETQRKILAHRGLPPRQIDALLESGLAFLDIEKSVTFFRFYRDQDENQFRYSYYQSNMMLNLETPDPGESRDQSHDFRGFIPLSRLLPEYRGYSDADLMKKWRILAPNIQMIIHDQEALIEVIDTPQSNTVDIVTVGNESSTNTDMVVKLQKKIPLNKMAQTITSYANIMGADFVAQFNPKVFFPKLLAA